MFSLVGNINDCKYMYVCVVWQFNNILSLRVFFISLFSVILYKKTTILFYVRRCTRIDINLGKSVVSVELE